MNSLKRDKRNIWFVVINVLIIFGFAFVVHNLYEWWPNFLTTLFPVNESLYEHLKMIFMTPVIISSVLYLIFWFIKKPINNYFGGLLVSTLANIIIFYVIYLPIYYKFGEMMIVTLIIYFVSIVLSQLINYQIIKLEHNRLFNLTSLISILIIIPLLLVFTYWPLKESFFLDPKTGLYGIKK